MNGFIVLAVIAGLVSAACWMAFRSGISSARKDAAEADAKAAAKEAQKWADKPRSPLDAALLLRRRSELKRDEANLLR